MPKRVVDSRTICSHVPVTSVCFAEINVSWGKRRFLLAGGGGFVSAFDLDDVKCPLIATVNILGSRNIHGFVLNHQDSNSKGLQLAVFGERFITSFVFDESFLKAKRGNKVPWQLADRVVDVQWIKTANEISLAVLLAHNEFLILDPTSGGIRKSVLCQERSILFSGLIANSLSSLYVISGACMGFLYLWKPLENTLGETLVHLNLSNAGGVFCIAIQKSYERFAIACEDRGIYTFEVYTDGSTVTQKQKLFGHAARIWKVCWVGENVVSAGEDSQVLLWNLADCSVIYRFESASNINFFSLTVDPSDSCLIGAGLSDGAVRLYNVNKLTSEALTERPGDDPAIPIGNMQDHVVVLRFLDENTLIYVSNAGSLCLVKLSNNSVEVLENNPHYSVAVVLTVKETSEAHFLIGLAHGVPSEITIFSIERVESEAWRLNKIKEFRCPGQMPRVYLFSWMQDVGLNSSGTLFSSNFDVARNCVFDVSGNMLLDFDLSTLTVPSRASNTLKHFDKVAVTCGIRFEQVCNKPLFVFGDNCGSVLAVRKSKIEDLEPLIIQIFPHIHGRDGCFSVHYNQFENSVITCGGSSTVGFFKMDVSSSDCPLTLLNVIKPCSSLDYTLMHFTSQDQEFVCGFAQKSFMLASVQPTHSILARHFCSGRKREWDTKIIANANLISAKFAYVKAGKTFMMIATVSPSDTKERALVPSLHGLLIHSCKFIAYLQKANCYVFALASEDSTASIIAIEDQKSDSGHDSKLHILHRLAGHISGVRCIQVLEIGPNEFLIFSGGSRGILIAWSLSLAEVAIADLKKSTFCRKIAQIALTNEIIGAQELPSYSQIGKPGAEIPKGAWRQRKVFGPPLSPDMRFMDATALQSPNDPGKYFVFLSCSDATIRIFELNHGDVYESTTFNPILCLSEGLSFCLLQIAFISIAEDNRGLIVSGDTGGFLNLWRWPEVQLDEAAKPVSVRLHQSGVNALQIFNACGILRDGTPGNSVLAFTGGDDTAIVVTLIELEANSIKSQELFRVNSAHGSQISGISYIKSLNVIFSVSVDQRVRLWHFVPDQRKPDSQCFLGGYVTCVADAASFAVFSSQKSCFAKEDNIVVLIVGEGCQLIKLHLGED